MSGPGVGEASFVAEGWVAAMLFALEPGDLKRFAIPIGIALGLLVIVAVPSLRRAVIERFRAGHRHGRRLSGRPEDEQDEDRGERR